MNYFIEHEIFTIHSHNRLLETDTDSDFSFKIELNPNVNYTHVVLLDCLVPKTYYLINSRNSTFTLSYNLGAGDIEEIIQLSYGNYNRRSFRSVLLTQLNANNGGYVFNITYQNNNSSFDDGKYYFSFTNANPSAQQPKFIFTDELWEQTGFQNKFY